MPFTLIEPGRRGNKHWVFRLKHPVTGQRIERTTGQTTYAAAQEYTTKYEAALYALSDETRAVTYGEAAEQYILDHQNMPKWDALVHRRIQEELRHKDLSQINQSTIIYISNLLYPNAKASTRNRWVVRPIASVMHYASEIGKCGWIRFKKFREEKPKTRAVDIDTASLIIVEAGKQEDRPEIKQLLCLWLFKHGNRISETLSLRGENINIKQKIFGLYISKTKTWKTFALDPEVIRALRKAFPKGMPEDRLFPWKTRWGVYKWLLPMCRGIGVEFSPHMARHSVGTWFSQQGASIRTTMERLGHDDLKSSMRYQAGDIEIVRQTNQKIGNLVRTKVRKVKKSHV